ncbi:uncharacterized protein RAG0_00006 [Rhynchosporium agropyri]|uniref:Uncharacterized protein n=1 Tax=Rhynchosporium agropyri TaxID=914238 RepID=A0A1E1JR55_9HELO|nr:uncharacterized protein RAG0_00006 [Rhynchosporium agropyri]
MKFTILTLPTLALAQLGAMLFEPMNSLCVVYTVEEKPIHISTCFPSSTVATIAGCTTTIPSATCIDTTITESHTLNPPTHTNVPAPAPTPADDPVYEYTTITTSVLTTFCPSPTTFIHGTKTYTITEATTLTITDCPCTYTRTKDSSEIATTTPVSPPATTPVVPPPESIPVDQSTSLVLSTYYSATGVPSRSVEIPVPSSGPPTIPSSSTEVPLLPSASALSSTLVDILISSSVVIIPSSTENVPSPTPTEDSCAFIYFPGEYPTEIGNGTLANLPTPAVYTYNEITYSFGFLGKTFGDKAYAEKNHEPTPTDGFAYYQVPNSILPATDECSNFGYLYHVDSGLCVTANATSNGEGPKFDGSELVLEPCGLCAGKPDIDQRFCVASTEGIANRDRPYQCLFFYGDFVNPLPYYGTVYGEGPDLAVATLNAGPGDCIWLLFPQPTCPEGFDLTSDPNNCGSCGNICPTGDSCTNSVCTTLPAPGPLLCESGQEAYKCEVNQLAACGAHTACFCLASDAGNAFCADTVNGSCGGPPGCTTTSDCGDGLFCAVGTCCGYGICLSATTCANPRNFRTMVKLDPSMDSVFTKGTGPQKRI